MAHIGRLAPVLFRRDFNLNVENNNNGWARRCIIHWAQFPTGPAGIWSNSTWDCGPDLQTGLAEITWRSDQVLKFAIHWWSEFQIRIPDHTYYRRFLRLQTLELGLALEVELIDQVIRPDYGRIFFDNRRVTFWDPAFFDQFPAGALISPVRPKLWADGPPH